MGHIHTQSRGVARFNDSGSYPRSGHGRRSNLRVSWPVFGTGSDSAPSSHFRGGQRGPGRRILPAVVGTGTDGARDGGPTGVELAGALAEIARHTIARDFRAIDPRNSRIILLEGGERLLPSFPPSLSHETERALGLLRFEVHTGALVTNIDDRGVELEDERIDSATILWAAGNVESPLTRSLGLLLDKVGRVAVEPNLTLPGYPNVYAIGDLAHVVDEVGAALPGVAPVAVQQGAYAGRHIAGQLRGRPVETPFGYRDKGNLATIGRAAAVAEIGRFRLSGWSAWIAWALVHIFYLIGFENRFLVMLRWIWSYLTYRRGARLITRGRNFRGPADDRPS